MPGAAAAADVTITRHDRVYAAERFSNTVSVIDPASNTLLGVIRLGDPSPMNFSPLYKGQVLVHGMGFSPDHRTIVHTATTPTSVTLFDQGLVQVLEASVTWLAPKHPYVLALSDRADGSGALQPLSGFMTNLAGGAIVNATGPIRQVVQGGAAAEHTLVIAPGTATAPGVAVQIQAR